VATQLHLARRNSPAAALRSIIEAQDCTKAFFDVPGHGLYLENIVYDRFS
ncbi:MAG: tRNA pseudouridine(38-40) synthase TruA, partial [Chitinophagia bacterium]|nr:tRNA pseudouridine(38-40) synthase TruA [Chitinophagia bacterium]